MAVVAPLVRFTKITLFDIAAMACDLSGVMRIIWLLRLLAVEKLPVMVRVIRSISVIVLAELS